MELILRYIDPDAAVGLGVAFILFGCAFLIYRMRDPTPFPRHIARRLWCPHRGRTFTVEFDATGAACYCSAFDSGELRCDQACTTRSVGTLGRAAAAPTKGAAA